MKKFNMNNEWKLFYFPQYEREVSLDDIKDKTSITATVPGNVELDLMKIGLLPEDLYNGENVKLTEQFEKYEWWYQTEFKMPEIEGTAYLNFEGVDCLAEYWLDDEKIGESDNMMIPVKLEIKNPIKDKVYKLTVRIRSAVLEAENIPYDMLTTVFDWQDTIESLHIRKARHSYGWDIMPRVVSAGIWKEVYLIDESNYDFNQFSYFVYQLRGDAAEVRFFYDFNSTVEGSVIEIKGECGDHSFEACEKVRFKTGFVNMWIGNPKLWYPKNYGEPNLYKTTVKLIKDGIVLAEKQLNVGIRTAQLKRTDYTDGENGDFAFYINGTRMQVYGTNWVPLDALHSREKDRYEKSLELLDDIGCNMVRCWGGNVYPEDMFYDYCDSHGIMVWQDFSMACGTYPQDEKFIAKMEKEVEAVVRRFRTHPSLVLWSGDNECDESAWNKITMKVNNITRKLLPEIIARNDVKRDFLPSSPYIPTGKEDETYLSERHLWGPRDYYKSGYYKDTVAHFASELGYHGFPAVESFKKFINGDIPVCEMKNNSECILHSTDHHGSNARFMLMENQITQLFGEVPQNLEDFALASQISQAEANKFFIELFRCHKPIKTGVIWWNLIDGWPQFSDAVVDYYFEKKLAYYMIKKCQEPVCVMLGEMRDWNHPIIIANDTLENVKVEYTVIDLDDDSVVKEGVAEIEPNGIKHVGNIKLFYSDKKCFKIIYKVNGVEKTNHYLAGLPPFSLEQYKAWLSKLDYPKTV